MSKSELMRVKMEIDCTEQLEYVLCELSSKHRGAWVFSILPFSHTVTFLQFKSPSSVPDYFYDLTKNRIGHKGKIVEFSKAAKQREQKRGHSGDR